MAKSKFEKRQPNTFPVIAPTMAIVTIFTIKMAAPLKGHNGYF